MELLPLPVSLGSLLGLLSALIEIGGIVLIAALLALTASH